MSMELAWDFATCNKKNVMLHHNMVRKRHRNVVLFSPSASDTTSDLIAEIYLSATSLILASMKKLLERNTIYL